MSKKSKKRLQSNKGNSQVFISLLSNIEDSPSRISHYRNTGLISSYASVIKFIRSNQSLQRRVFNPEYPSSPQQLKIVQNFNNTSFEREVRWAGAYLVTHASKISEFIKLSNKFQEAILKSDYKSCEQLLNEIESRFGFSLWLIKNKLAYLQLTKGLEAQKQFTAFVRMNDENPLVAFIAYYVSIRNEATISYSKFSTMFRKQVLENGILQEDLKAYVQYHIDPSFILTEEDIRNILRFEGTSSVIDYYETLIFAAQATVSNRHTNLYSSIASALEPLQSVIEDNRINYLLCLLRETPLSNNLNNADIIEAYNFFLSGDYESAYYLASELLINNCDNFDLMELAACSYSMLANPPSRVDNLFIDGLITSMVSVIKKSDDFAIHLNYLIKVTQNFASFYWSQGILGIVLRQISTRVDYGGEVQRFVATATFKINPFRVGVFSGTPFQKIYAQTLRSLCEDCLTSIYTEAVINGFKEQNISKLSWEEEKLLIAQKAYQIGQFSDSLNAAIALEQSVYTYYRQKAIVIKSHCLLKLNRVAECVEFVTSIYIKEPEFWYILPIKEVMLSIDGHTDEQLNKSISLPILYDMHSKFVDSTKESIRKYSYEDFLFANKIERPSELSEIISNIDIDKVIYFLRNVCVESVMDISVTVFTSSREVAEERVKVCRLLVELDPESAEVYHDEIKTILRRLMIQNRMREIEQSKIYVDVEGIKKKVELTMKETFLRYISFVKNNLNADLADWVKEAVKDTSYADKLIVVVLPQNEMLDIFHRMVVELRDEFISNNVHGLDGYLSVRIRHGILESQLRKPLEESNLITERDSVTDNYKPNFYWIEILNIDDIQIQSYLISRLADFARDFDELVQVIRNEWIQIKKDNNEKGLFNFDLDKRYITLLSSSIKEDTKFDEFFDYIFREFFLLLEANLEIVRRTFNETAKLKVNTLLTELQNDVENLRDYDTSDLSNAISATRTEMQIVFNRVTEWFRLSKSTAKEPLSLEDVITISKESVSTTPYAFKVHTDVQDTEEVFFGGNKLISFVDILFIIFENIIKHSKVDQPRAFINVTRHEDSVKIFIENDIGEGVATTTAIQRVKTIKSGMNDDIYIKSVTTEGGTGLHKIRNIIARDFYGATELDFGFGNNGRFFVEFTLPAKMSDYEDFDS